MEPRRITTLFVRRAIAVRVIVAVAICLQHWCHITLRRRRVVVTNTWIRRESRWLRQTSPVRCRTCLSGFPHQ